MNELLHRHPLMEANHMLSNNHYIVDRKDWLAVRKILDREPKGLKVSIELEPPLFITACIRVVGTATHSEEDRKEVFKIIESDLREQFKWTRKETMITNTADQPPSLANVMPGAIEASEARGQAELVDSTQLPVGWKKEATDHSMWSKLVDATGKEIASIFYKAAFYDRRAFMRLA